MGQAKKRGTREERIAQSQAVASMRRDEAAALAVATTADAHHAAKQRIRQLQQEEIARQLRNDPRTAVARAKAGSMVMVAAALSANSFSCRPKPQLVIADEIATFDK